MTITENMLFDEFGKVKEMIATYALSALAKEEVVSKKPSTNPMQIKQWLKEITEAKRILNISSSVPLHHLNGIDLIMKGLHKGVVFRPDQLNKLYDFIDTVRKLKRFMNDKESVAPQVSSYAFSMFDLTDLSREIIRCIKNGRVDDYASRELLKIRKQITILEDRLKERINQFIKSAKYAKYIQENIIGNRDGRYVIAVKSEYKRMINGAILDTSASGATVYIEPAEVASIQQDIYYLKADQEIEEQKILQYLTGLVESYAYEINLNIDAMVHYDVLFAKAKHSQEFDCKEVAVNEDAYICLKNAKHPLLYNEAVPIDVELGKGFKALVITGPNTGGKTVTLKTVGLIHLMIQSGFHAPVGMNSEIAVFKSILVDIGDGQSIEESLSTFSSRIKNIIEILKETNSRSLVLIDELGTGTDPSEGMGLATSILEELYKMGATILATTHFSEIKQFASETKGFENASMEFDLQTLKPTYRLIIGKGGESQAFSIALQLGMHPKIIERAYYVTYKKKESFDLANNNFHYEQQLAVNKKHYEKKEKLHAWKKTSSNIVNYCVGDNVKIPHLNEYGIIKETVNENGDVHVLVKGEILKMNYKRVSLYVKAEDLYPEGYDLSQIFDSKEVRKKRNVMKKKHVDGLTIDHTNDCHNNKK
ncbi:MutS2 family protein [Salirhabdus euzebyi]|uniref:MutS2 family protein n=1 Tax=Salirhabdus euzebyi TaxID=394506 RepID=A0A841Q4P3_9BACI|nr:endonuclease MutS2 [Salirhabdus euzebyi]MBB6453364.1 MutS2 family protein [Salirhabdus euzebyi]